MGLRFYLQTFQEENLESFVREHLELRKKSKLLKQAAPEQRLLTHCLFSSSTPCSGQNKSSSSSSYHTGLNRPLQLRLRLINKVLKSLSDVSNTSQGPFLHAVMCP